MSIRKHVTMGGGGGQIMMFRSRAGIGYELSWMYYGLSWMYYIGDCHYLTDHNTGTASHCI